MNGPRGVRHLGGEHPQAPIRPHARALSRGRDPEGPHIVLTSRWQEIGSVLEEMLPESRS